MAWGNPIQPIAASAPSHRDCGQIGGATPAIAAMNNVRNFSTHALRSAQHCGPTQ